MISNQQLKKREKPRYYATDFPEILEHISEEKRELYLKYRSNSMVSERIPSEMIHHQMLPSEMIHHQMVPSETIHHQMILQER